MIGCVTIARTSDPPGPCGAGFGSDITSTTSTTASITTAHGVPSIRVITFRTVKGQQPISHPRSGKI
jgi:hypothetical protein